MVRSIDIIPNSGTVSFEFKLVSIFHKSLSNMRGKFNDFHNGYLENFQILFQLICNYSN